MSKDFYRVPIVAPTLKKTIQSLDDMLIALLQGIFPTQESNPGLLHCWWILYHLSHQGSPDYNWTFFFFFLTQERTGIHPDQNKRISCVWICLSCSQGPKQHHDLWGYKIFPLLIQDPVYITSGQQSHFIAKKMQQLAHDSGISWPYHIPYHPQAPRMFLKGVHLEIKYHYQICRIHTKSTTT